MGLLATAKGLTAETEYCCGYITYGVFIKEIVKAAYGGALYKMYEDAFRSSRCFTEEEAAIWNANCNDDLDLLIWHSDCDGKFTPNECRRIYNALKNLHLDMQGHNYGVMKPYNMLDHWKAMFQHCAKRRVNLYYS